MKLPWKAPACYSYTQAEVFALEIYALYRQRRSASLQALNDLGAAALPLRAADLCKRLGIRLSSIGQAKSFLLRQDLWQEASRLAGLSVRVGPQWYVLYSRALLDSGRARYTVALELGRILLGHALEDVEGVSVFRSRLNTGDLSPCPRDGEEREAAAFACGLLAPLCVLDALRADTPPAVARLGGLPPAAARFQAGQLAIARSRGTLLPGPLEHEVLDRFAPFLQRRRDEG